MSAASHPPHVGMPHEAARRHRCECAMCHITDWNAITRASRARSDAAQPIDRTGASAFPCYHHPDSRTQPHLSSAEHMSKVLANQARDSVRHHYEVCTLLHFDAIPYIRDVLSRYGRWCARIHFQARAGNFPNHAAESLGGPQADVRSGLHSRMGHAMCPQPMLQHIESEAWRGTWSEMQTRFGGVEVATHEPPSVGAAPAFSIPSGAPLLHTGDTASTQASRRACAHGSEPSSALPAPSQHGAAHAKSDADQNVQVSGGPPTHGQSSEMAAAEASADEASRSASGAVEASHTPGSPRAYEAPPAVQGTLGDAASTHEATQGISLGATPDHPKSQGGRSPSPCESIESLEHPKDSARYARVLAISGASCSGKTALAKRLRHRLIADGLTVHIIHTDDHSVGRTHRKSPNPSKTRRIRTGCHSQKLHMRPAHSVTCSSSKDSAFSTHESIFQHCTLLYMR